MINENEKKLKFKIFNTGAKVKLKLSDERINVWAYKKAHLYNSTTAELKQEMLDKYMGEDGYLCLPLSDAVEISGGHLGDKILINEDDLQEQQTKLPEPEREM